MRASASGHSRRTTELLALSGNAAWTPGGRARMSRIPHVRRCGKTARSFKTVRGATATMICRVRESSAEPVSSRRSARKVVNAAMIRCRSYPAPLTFAVLFLAGAPAWARAQTLTLPQALDAATAHNRGVRSAALQQAQADQGIRIAGTHRLPVFSLTTLVSQPLTQLGVTLERGVLGSYPGTGPIPGATTTLASPLQVGSILYASIAQPLTQQYRIGIGIEAAHV